MYDIAVILINYNSSKFTTDAIESIIKVTSISLNYQIIVVDNASRYEDYILVKDYILSLEAENIKLFRSKINTGFGAGNMFGIQFSNARYYAFINNDTLLKNDCLDVLFNFMKTHENIALCAPQGYDENGNVLKGFDHFLSLKRELFGRKIFEKLNPKKYPKRNKKYEEPIKVQCIPGSFLFVDARSFDNVGGFDTNIFLYYEETDLAFRISKLKEKNECYLMPKAEYIHFKGQSTAKSLAIKKEMKISLLYVLKKNSSYFSYLILKYYLTVQYLFKSIFKPKYFSLVVLFIQGAPLNKSLKQSQKIAVK